MASGTLISRVTGLFRVLVLAWVLGFTPISDAFNLANTVPNMLFDVVLGGILGATFIPVFVERLALDGERRAWRSISSVITAAILVLVAASAVSWFCAPWIIDGFTALQHTSSAHSAAVLAQERAVATELLRWFVPQIFFYGIIGIATSLLNIRRRFGVATWVPIANNVVCI
ncbi:MAG TPA: lipid II flippase MurJ, partial [Acidimicrobiales bacterium]|nr:lipid II flippase MurJ [Acidimicrobiales bacterium]